jgi:DNA-directed RNA polymerase specialized sigma24 family protein
MADQQDVERMASELRQAGEDRIRYRQLSDEASQKARALVAELRKTGMSVREIAEISGYHQRAVDGILRDAGLTQRQLLEQARKRDTDQ